MVLFHFLTYYALKIFLDFNVLAHLLCLQRVSCVMCSKMTKRWLKVLLFILKRNQTFLTAFTHGSRMCWFFSQLASIGWPYASGIEPCHHEVVTWQITTRGDIRPVVSTWLSLSLRPVNCFHIGNPNGLGVFLTHSQIFSLVFGPLKLFFIFESCKPFVKNGHAVDHGVSFVLRSFWKAKDWVAVLKNIFQKSTYNVVRCVYRGLNV